MLTLFRVSVVAAVAAAAAAEAAPELPAALSSLAGSGRGYARVLGDEAACPARLQLGSDWKVVQLGGGGKGGKKEMSAVALVAPKTTGEEAATCGYASVHMMPDVAQAAEGEGVLKVREQAVVGKMRFNGTDPRCVPAGSPPRTRVTLLTKALVDSVKAEMVPHMKLDAIKGVFGADSTRMMFYRNRKVGGKLKNCVYVDGSVDPKVDSDGMEKFFTATDGRKMRPAMEMFTKSLLFGTEKGERGSKGFKGKGMGRGKGRGRGRGKGKGKKERGSGSEDKEANDDKMSGLDDTDPGHMMAMGGMAPASASKRTKPKANSADKSTSPSCFPASAAVTLENGSIKRMDELVIGDRVSIGGGRFSDIFMFTHKLPSARANFITLNTASGASITLTSGHYLPVESGNLVAAAEVRIGDALVLGDGSASRVIDACSGTGVGLFNPQTISGDLLVGDVMASTYTEAVEPSVAHAALAPFRALYRAFGVTTSALDGGADGVLQKFLEFLPKPLKKF